MNVGSNIQDISSKVYKIVELLSSGTKKTVLHKLCCFCCCCRRWFCPRISVCMKLQLLLAQLSMSRVLDISHYFRALLLFCSQGFVWFLSV